MPNARRPIETPHRDADFARAVGNGLDRRQWRIIGTGNAQTAGAHVNAQRALIRAAAQHKGATALRRFLRRQADCRPLSDQGTQRLAFAAESVQGGDLLGRQCTLPDRQFVELAAQSVRPAPVRVADQYLHGLGRDADVARRDFSAVDVEPHGMRRSVGRHLWRKRRRRHMHPAPLRHALRALHSSVTPQQREVPVEQLEHPGLLSRQAVITGGEDRARLAGAGRGFVSNPTRNREVRRRDVALRAIEIDLPRYVHRFAGHTFHQPLSTLPTAYKGNVAGAVAHTVVVRAVEAPVVDQVLREIDRRPRLFLGTASADSCQ